MHFTRIHMTILIVHSSWMGGGVSAPQSLLLRLASCYRQDGTCRFGAETGRSSSGRSGCNDLFIAAVSSSQDYHGQMEELMSRELEEKINLQKLLPLDSGPWLGMLPLVSKKTCVYSQWCLYTKYDRTWNVEHNPITLLYKYTILYKYKKTLDCLLYYMDMINSIFNTK